MGKIYRRETLKIGTTPKKKDEKRRKRNVIMKLSGITGGKRAY